MAHALRTAPDTGPPAQQAASRGGTSKQPFDLGAAHASKIIGHDELSRHKTQALRLPERRRIDRHDLDQGRASLGNHKRLALGGRIDQPRQCRLASWMSTVGMACSLLLSLVDPFSNDWRYAGGILAHPAQSGQALTKIVSFPAPVQNAPPLPTKIVSLRGLQNESRDIYHDEAARKAWHDPCIQGGCLSPSRIALFLYLEFPS
jgi:hypothetical protein